MMVRITPRVELDFGAGWVDVSADVVSAVKADWGIHGADPGQRVADVGAMSFELDNSAQNSGSTRGYYSPDGPDVRPGFEIGTPARLVLNHALFGDKVMWVGIIDDIRAEPGVENQRAAVHCEDWMAEALRAKATGLSVLVDTQADAAFLAIAESVERTPPGGITALSGSDIYAFALDGSESGTVDTELQKIAASEFGLVYVTAGRLVFEGRRRRSLGQTTVRFAMDEDEQIVGLKPSYGRDRVVNKIQVTVHPRSRDAAPTSVLFKMGSALELFRGTSAVLTCPYRDPSQTSQNVGGLDMVDPEPGVDYSFNAEPDGSGADLTSQLTVTVTFGGNSAEVVIENSGPHDGYVPAGAFQLRGRGIYDFLPILVTKADAASLAKYGESYLQYDMPYQSSSSAVVKAEELALYILSMHKDAKVRVESVSFVANWSDETAEQAFSLALSDIVSVTSASLGLTDARYYVNGISLEVALYGAVVVTYDLDPVNVSSFWRMQIDGATELDETTVLGYGLFAASWTLDTSQLGTDTFLN